jgi:hypothetical protein
MGSVYWQLGDREKGLALMEQAEAFYKAVRSPDTEVVAGFVAQMREVLQQKKTE